MQAASSASGPRPPERIVLTGFMGSGKTTVGRELARQLGWTFADLDAVVSDAEGLSVPEIFAQRGEPYFRTAEVKALQRLLGETHRVIALGGGAPETEALRALLAADAGSWVVHLHAPAEVLFARCVAQAEDPTAAERPLLGSAEMAATRYGRRLPLYTAMAQHRADVTERGPVEIAAALVQILQTEMFPR